MCCAGGSNRAHRGEVVTEHADGTFDVMLADGSVLSRVPEEDVRLDMGPSQPRGRSRESKLQGRLVSTALEGEFDLAAAEDTMGRLPRDDRWDMGVEPLGSEDEEQDTAWDDQVRGYGARQKQRGLVERKRGK